MSSQESNNITKKKITSKYAEDYSMSYVQYGENPALIEVEDRFGEYITMPKIVFDALRSELHKQVLKDKAEELRQKIGDATSKVQLGFVVELDKFIHTDIEPKNVYPTCNDQDHYEFVRGKSLMYSLYKEEFKNTDAYIRLLGWGE